MISFFLEKGVGRFSFTNCAVVLFDDILLSTLLTQHELMSLFKKLVRGEEVVVKVHSSVEQNMQPLFVLLTSNQGKRDTKCKILYNLSSKREFMYTVICDLVAEDGGRLLESTWLRLVPARRLDPESAKAISQRILELSFVGKAPCVPEKVS